MRGYSKKEEAPMADSCPPHSIDPKDRERAKGSTKGITVKCKNCGKRLRLKPGSGESIKDEAKVMEALAQEIAGEHPQRDGESDADHQKRLLNEAVLTMEQRKAMPKSDFVFPEKAPGPGSYPIGDKGHAQAALGLSAGKPEEAAVKAAVYKRYPEMKGAKEGASA